MKPEIRVLKDDRATAFQQCVYDAVCRIPTGEVSTYGAIAKAIGCGSSRAIGQALHRNPYGDEIPCHRVISADLTLGGYGDSNHPDLTRKRRLLEREGVTFDAEGRVTSKVAQLKSIPNQSNKAPAKRAKIATRLRH